MWAAAPLSPQVACLLFLSPGSPMPSFASLGDARLQQLAIFLVDSKGKQ